MAKAVSKREKGKLPSTSEVNPKDVMAISLRSGKVFDEPSVEVRPKQDKGKDVKVEEQPMDEEKWEKNEELNSNKNEEVKPYIPPIPFPQRLKDRSKQNNFMNYLEMFKKIQMNTPFIEAISHMPQLCKILERNCL